MTITAAMVKELRELTGAGMMDCKKALQENDGNIEASIDWLREKGIAKAAKKADRVAAEGLTRAVTAGNKAVLVEVNSETDFVAKNPDFQALVETIATHLLNSDVATLEAAMATTIEGVTLETFIAEATAKIGEKLSLRRFEVVTKTDADTFGTYLHNGGKIGVVTVLANTTDEDAARNVSMHVAAMNPKFVDRSEIAAEFIEKERGIQLEITKNDPKTADKPEQVLKGIVEGKLNKQLKEMCLVDQPFVMNSDQTVGAFVASVKGTVSKMVRFEVGDGIEKKEDDFAAEVAATVAGI